MKKIRNPRYAPEFLEGRLCPSGFASPIGASALYATTQPGPSSAVVFPAPSPQATAGVAGPGLSASGTGAASPLVISNPFGDPPATDLSGDDPAPDDGSADAPAADPGSDDPAPDDGSGDAPIPDDPEPEPPDFDGDNPPFVPLPPLPIGPAGPAY